MCESEIEIEIYIEYGVQNLDWWVKEGEKEKRQRKKSERALDKRQIVLPEGEPRLESGSVSLKTLQNAASAATKRSLIGCSYPARQTCFRKKRQRNEAEHSKNNETNLT